MKKRWTALLLALLLAVSLTACGDKTEPQETPDQETVEPETPETVPETGETQEPEAEPLPADPDETPEAGDLPAEPAPEAPAKPVEKPAEKPASKPEELPAEKPAKPAENPAEKPPQATVDLSAFFAGLTDLPGMMPVEGETLDAFYAGLSDIARNQTVVNMAAISAAVGEIALVEVQNSSDVQAVKDIFQARIDYQTGADGGQPGAWYPQTVEGWQNNSRIVSNGSFVMLAVVENADDVVAQFNALFA